MGFFGLCEGDPVVSTLRDVFGANIVRVPERRIQPLSVVAGRGDKSAFRGKLAELLVGKSPIALTPTPSPMTSVTGKRSREVNVDFGLDILSSVLKGFNIPSTGVELAFEGATEVSFAFGGVTRQFIDKGELGSALQGKRLDRTQPAAALFFGDDPWELLIIDSAITSDNFTIAVEQTRSTNFKINIGLIQQIVDKADVGVAVSVAADRVLTFKGPEALTFAFTCVPLHLDGQGLISTIGEDERERQLAAARATSQSGRLAHVVPASVLLNRTPSMIEWDAWPE